MSELVDINSAKRELLKKKNSPDTLDREDRYWLTRYELSLLQNGQTPFEYLLGVMRDDFNPPEIRMKAATTLMPYVQQMAPRVSEIEDAGMSATTLRESSIVREKLAALVGVILTPSAPN